MQLLRKKSTRKNIFSAKERGKIPFLVGRMEKNVYLFCASSKSYKNETSNQGAKIRNIFDVEKKRHKKKSNRSTDKKFIPVKKIFVYLQY